MLDAVLANHVRPLWIQAVFLTQELLDLGHLFCELLVGWLQLFAARAAVSVELDDGRAVSLLRQRQTLAV